jgi:hypothetical protein
MNGQLYGALLAASDWSDVTNSQCVDGANTAFWSNYSDLYEIGFPLLKSRGTKQQLYEQTLINPSEFTRAKYKNYCRIYFKTIRAAKKLHFSRLLTKNAKYVKKFGIPSTKHLAGVKIMKILRR